jgi:uncharacterized protein YigE (DUF2233 family)
MGTVVRGRFLVQSSFGLLVLLASAATILAEPRPCRSVTYAGSDYTVCEIDLRQHVVQFFWNRADGRPPLRLADQDDAHIYFFDRLLDLRRAAEAK